MNLTKKRLQKLLDDLRKTKKEHPEFFPSCWYCNNCNSDIVEELDAGLWICSDCRDKLFTRLSDLEKRFQRLEDAFRGLKGNLKDEVYRQEPPPFDFFKEEIDRKLEIQVRHEKGNRESPNDG